MGIVAINGLKIFARHGVYEQERRVGNDFEVTLHLDVPCSDAAMDTDNLSDTINYAEVVGIIKDEMSMPSRLLEHVAGRIRHRLEQTYHRKIAGGELTLAKLAPPIPAELASVSFTTRWGTLQSGK